MTVTYDPTMADEYFAMLFGNVEWQPGQVFSLLGIGEKGTPKEGAFKERKIIPPGFIGMAHGHLKRWGEHKVAGFIVPAVLHATAENAGDVTLDKLAALTALILDLDSGDVNARAKFVIAALGKPTMMVASGGVTETGQPKGHLYWRLDEPCEDVERVAALRKLLASKCGGDPSFGRATQVIRVPGSVHAKNGQPSLCRIVERNAIDYNLDDLAEIIEAMLPMPGLPTPKSELPALTLANGFMDFSPPQDTAQAALHRDVHEGGTDLTRWGEFNKVAGFAIRECRDGRMTPAQAAQHADGWMQSHMVPPWPEARFQQEFIGLWNADIKQHGPMPGPAAPVISLTEGRVIEPSPAQWRHSSMIPPREWLFGRWLMRGKVTAMIAPGGVGKSSLVAGILASMASNRAFMGKDIYGGPLPVWYLNLEDDGDDMARSRAAVAIKHGISEAECGGRMYADSGPDGVTICLAYDDRVGFHMNDIDYVALETAIVSRSIAALFIDPWVSSHQIDENDNGKIDAVVKRLAGIARRTRCAIVLVHHSRKLNGERVTADSARGAGALNNAARMTLVLNRMTFEQAEGWGIEPHTAPQYFSVGDDKHNLAAAEAADWFHIEGICLNNASDIHPADNVGVVVPWQPPRAMDGVGASDLYQIQNIINLGRYRHSSQSEKEAWVGEPISNILKIPIDDIGKKRINAILKTWIKSGALKVESMAEPSRGLQKPYVVVGNWVADPRNETMTTEGAGQWQTT